MKQRFAPGLNDAQLLASTDGGYKALKKCLPDPSPTFLHQRITSHDIDSLALLILTHSIICCQLFFSGEICSRAELKCWKNHFLVAKIVEPGIYIKHWVGDIFPPPL